MPLDLLFVNVDKLCADLLIVRVLFIEGWYLLTDILRTMKFDIPYCVTW
jgi:hypothetical protein